MSTIQSSDEHLTLNADGTAKEIKLQANGVEKAKVTSTGIDVTGSVTADGLTVGDSATSNVIGSVVSANNTSAGLDFLGDLSGTKGVRIKYEGNGNLFSVSENNSGTLTERLRISDDGDISFYEDTGTTPKFFWDASAESLGIGTSSPDAPFTIQRPSNNQGIAAGLSLKGQDGTTQGGLGTDGVIDNAVQLVAAQFLKFHTNNTDGTTNERMRIDSSGNLLVGRTATGWLAGGGFRADGSTESVVASGIAGRFGRGTTTGTLLEFRYNNSIVGSIQTSGSSTSYNTSSDYRLKENVVPMTGSIDRLKELKPSRFNFIADADTTVDGFLAHEAGEVVPEAVSGEKDAMTTEEYEVEPAVEATYDEDGNVLTEAVEAVMGEREVPDYQGIDQSKLVPLLTSALQEAVAKIEALETRIETLEAN